MNTITIQALTNIEEAIGDYKHGLMTAEAVQKRVMDEARTIELDQRETDYKTSRFCANCDKEWLDGSGSGSPVFLCPGCSEGYSLCTKCGNVVRGKEAGRCGYCV